MMQTQLDVVVLGLSPTGLYAVREAARAGYKVLGIGAPGACGLFSRYLYDKISAETPAQRVEAIFNYISTNNHRKPVLIVTSDQDLEAVLDRSEELKEIVHLQSSYIDGLASLMMNKDQFYQVCEELNVDYPTQKTINVVDLYKYRDKIDYPCMIKPARIQAVKHLMGGHKGWIVKNASNFDEITSGIPEQASDLIVQAIVPGAESEITLWCGLIDEFGTVRHRFTARKLRQYPAGFGSASLVRSEICTETATIAERLLTEIGYRGIAAAEFKRDAVTGALKIIEVNPRPSLWFSISSKAGIRLVETLVAEYCGQAPQERKTQAERVLWRYTVKDYASFLFYLRNKSFILPPPNTSVSGRHHVNADVVFAWDDPIPGIIDILALVAKKMKRLIRKGRQ